MDPSNSTIFNSIIATASTVSVATATAVPNISSWKRKYVDSIQLNTFHFKDDVVKIYEKKTGKTFTDDLCTTLVVYINNQRIQFFNPKDNLRLLEFKFNGLTYDQDTFGISEDGLTFFSRDQDYMIISTMTTAEKGILPINKNEASGYFNKIQYSLRDCRNSPQISTSDYSKFCFNKSCEQFALAYDGFYKGYEDEVKLTKNGKTQLSIHNSFTGSVKRLIEIDVFGISQMSFSDDGVHIALITTTTSTIMIYNTITGKLVTSHVDETLKDVCPYSNNIRWSPDSTKIAVTVTHFEDEKLAYSSILCFSNIFGEVKTDKIVINGMERSMNIGNWDEHSENICFYSDKYFYTFNFDTNTFAKKTLNDNLTDYISKVQFVTSDLMVVVRGVKEMNVFKDKTYKSSYLPDCPPDNEVPYVDIVEIK